MRCHMRVFTREQSFPNKLWFMAVLLSVLVTSITNAETSRPAEEKITFEVVLSHTLAASPLVKEIDAKISQRLAEALSVRILPNPELQVGVMFLASQSDAQNQYGASISQPFKLSYFGLRDTVASLLEQSGRADQRFSIIELVQNVRLAYVKLWALQQQKVYFVEARERARKTGRLIAQGSSKGLFGQGEEKLFTAELERASADLTGLEAEIKKAEAELLRFSTFSTAGQLLTRPIIMQPSDLEIILRDSTLGTLPIQDRFALLEKVSRERFKLAKKDAFPALTPQLSYSQNEDGFDFVGVGLTFEIPFFNRNQAEQLQRSSEQSAASAQRQYFQGPSFQSELGLLLESFRGSIAQAKAYEEKVVPALESAISAYDTQLRAGQGNILLVWQAQKELRGLQGQLLERWVKAFSNQSELMILTGKEF